MEPNFTYFAAFKEAAQPSTPDSGIVLLYAKTDKNLYYRNSDGAEVAVSGGAGGGGGGTTYTAGSGLVLVGTQFNTAGSGNFDVLRVRDTATISGVVTNSIQFSGALPNAGFMTWNDGDGTASLTLKGGNVTATIAQDNIIMCNNGTPSTLSKGQVVYVSGVQGQRPKVNLAIATSDLTSARTIGVADESIASGAEGFVATFGVVHNIDTSSFIEGSGLWLSASTSGALTMTRPVAPNHGVFVGWCLNAHPSAGRIFVEVQNGLELEELHDVNISSPASGNLIQYDGTVWRNLPSTGVNVYLNATLDNNTSGTFYPVFVSASGTNVAPRISSALTYNPGTDIFSVSGHLTATTKSFLIPHPTKSHMSLRYGSLESPYHGVRLTGRDTCVSGECTVALPQYIGSLVHTDGVNIQLTNINHFHAMCVKNVNVNENTFVVSSQNREPCEFYWSFTAIRKDTPHMIVEQELQSGYSV